MTDLQRERIRRWVAALRSGVYRQGPSRLRRLDGTYCCLGVACDIFAKETDVQWTGRQTDNPGEIPIPTVMLGESVTLPREVVAWFGLDGNDPQLRGTEGWDAKASMMNDTWRLSFAQIADAIERTYLPTDGAEGGTCSV